MQLQTTNFQNLAAAEKLRFTDFGPYPLKVWKGSRGVPRGFSINPVLKFFSCAQGSRSWKTHTKEGVQRRAAAEIGQSDYKSFRLKQSFRLGTLAGRNFLRRLLSQSVSEDLKKPSEVARDSGFEVGSSVDGFT